LGRDAKTISGGWKKGADGTGAVGGTGDRTPDRSCQVTVVVREVCRECGQGWTGRKLRILQGTRWQVLGREVCRGAGSVVGLRGVCQGEGLRAGAWVTGVMGDGVTGQRGLEQE
jgi:hypothetical protein